MKVAVFDLTTGRVLTVTKGDEATIQLTHGDEADEAVRVLDGTRFEVLTRTSTIEDGQLLPTLTLEQFDAAHPSAPA